MLLKNGIRIALRPFPDAVEIFLSESILAVHRPGLNLCKPDNIVFFNLSKTSANAHIEISRPFLRSTGKMELFFITISLEVQESVLEQL